MNIFIKDRGYKFWYINIKNRFMLVTKIPIPPVSSFCSQSLWVVVVVALIGPTIQCIN